jgi:DNA topoisomerase-1
MKIIRLGTYKTGFTYYKVSGRSGSSGNKVEITDSKEIDKIRALKIPPAYENVTILNNKKIIAFGYDSKNRKQVLYHPSFIAKQNIKKYNKISMASIKFFSKLKRKISEDLGGGSSSSRGNEKTLATAVIITLILSCGVRIGNKKYEKVNNSVGLTTLKYKHIEFQETNQKLIIDFIGKKGVRNVAECDNKIIYDYLYQKNKNNMNHSDGDRSDRRDAYVFTYDGSKVISSSDVNEYLRRISEPYSIVITTKDLRTWNANMLFLMYYKKLRKQKQKQKQKRHSSETAAVAAADVSATATAAATAADTKDIEKDIKKAIEMVAEKLHNSYSICKKSYIDPKIIEELLEKDKK